jgi:hypothetical protein
MVMKYLKNLLQYALCIASYQIFIYTQLRAGQHIAYIGYAMELATRELGFDARQGKGFFSSSWCQTGIWGSPTIPHNM